MATPKAVEIIQLALEIEIDSMVEEECDFDIEEEGEESIQDDHLELGEGVLLGIKMVREHQKGLTDWQS